jgi:hypothetical protein
LFIAAPKDFIWRFSIQEMGKVSQNILFNQIVSNNDLEELPFARRFYHTKKYSIKGVYAWNLFFQLNSPKGDTLYSGTTTLSVRVE